MPAASGFPRRRRSPTSRTSTKASAIAGTTRRASTSRTTTSSTSASDRERAPSARAEDRQLRQEFDRAGLGWVDREQDGQHENEEEERPQDALGHGSDSAHR